MSRSRKDELRGEWRKSSKQGVSQTSGVLCTKWMKRKQNSEVIIYLSTRFISEFNFRTWNRTLSYLSKNRRL